MLIQRGFLAAGLVIGARLVAAQVDTVANCLSNGYSECVCNCQVPLINQYCPVISDLTHCSCTNTEYIDQVVGCVLSAKCPGLTGVATVASSICAKFGYPFLATGFIISTSASTATATDGPSGSGVIQTSASSLATSNTGPTGSNSGSVTAPTPTNTGVSGGQSSGVSTTKSSGGLAPGAIAGIVIGSIAVLVVAILGTICILQRGAKNKAAANQAVLGTQPAGFSAGKPPHTEVQEVAGYSAVSHTPYPPQQAYSNPPNHYPPNTIYPSPIPSVSPQSHANTASPPGYAPRSELPSQHPHELAVPHANPHELQ